MTHATPTARERTRAALYAIGALEPAEADEYRRHLTGCAACTAEVAGFAAVTESLLVAPPSIMPRPALRDRVLASIEAERVPTFHFVLASEGSWDTVVPGVSRKQLAPQTYLIRVDPGTRVPTHEHGRVEHCFVIAGDLRIAGRHLHGGDYHRAAAGSMHDEPSSDGGCTLLIVEAAA